MIPKYQILSKPLGVVVKHRHDRLPDPTSILGVYVKCMLNVCNLRKTDEMHIVHKYQETKCIRVKL